MMLRAGHVDIGDVTRFAITEIRLSVVVTLISAENVT